MPLMENDCSGESMIAMMWELRSYYVISAEILTAIKAVLFTTGQARVNPEHYL